MKEESSQIEANFTKFTQEDLTPFEHMMIGSSEDVVVSGNMVLVNSESLADLRGDKNALRQILSPTSLTRGIKTLDEVTQARRNGGFITGLFTLFDLDAQLKLIELGIKIGFVPGELNQNGQLDAFDIIFQKNGKKISPAEKPVLHKDFSQLLEYAGEKNNAMKFKVIAGI